MYTYMCINLHYMTLPYLTLHCICIQEIGGHDDFMFQRGRQLTAYWLQQAVGDLSATHEVHISGPYVALVRKDRPVRT